MFNAQNYPNFDCYMRQRIKKFRLYQMIFYQNQRIITVCGFTGVRKSSVLQQISRMSQKQIMIKQATIAVDSLANEFTRLLEAHKNDEGRMGRQPKPIKLAEYLKQRSTSQKRSFKSRLLPEDQGSLIMRKKRDEVLRNIDKLVRLLQEIKGNIIQRNDISLLVSQDIKIKEITELAHECQVMLKNGLAVISDYALYPPQNITVSGQGQKSQKLEDGPPNFDFPNKSSQALKRSYSPMRSVSEIQRIVEQQVGKPLVDSKPVNQARPPYAKKKSTVERVSSEAEELIQSRILTNPAEVLQEKQSKHSQLKQSYGKFFKASNTSHSGEDYDLKESLYQPVQPLDSSASIANPLANLRPTKKSLTVAIKNSNFRLGEQQS